MGNRTLNTRGRTLLAGKVIFNYGQSTIDCVVRRITDEGATIELQSGQGVPVCFRLSITGEAESLPALQLDRRSFFRDAPHHAIDGGLAVVENDFAC